MSCLASDAAFSRAGRSVPHEPVFRRLRGAMLICGALVLGSCGGPTTTGPPPGPTRGGTITGRYTLELRPAPSCTSATGPVSFPMVVTEMGTYPHPGVQLVIEGSGQSPLELELEYTDFTLEGGFGTIGDGVPSSQGPQAWVNSIGTGSAMQTSDGRGEVASGTLRGYLEIEGMNACNATDHGFSLRPR
jgi:hypothetical protein